MPEITLVVRYPDGVVANCYSPSTVVRQYFHAGETLPLDEFLRRSDQAFNHASERVRSKYGFACSSALAQLDTILESSRHYPADSVIEIISV